MTLIHRWLLVSCLVTESSHGGSFLQTTNPANTVNHTHWLGWNLHRLPVSLRVTKTFVLSFHWPWSPGLAKKKLRLFSVFLPSQQIWAWPFLDWCWPYCSTLSTHYHGETEGCATKSADAIIFCSKLFSEFIFWLSRIHNEQLQLQWS